ncbi:MAG: protease SohB [Aliidiomarina sp.]|uniref:protease SohB n=1 Tax=Aliidiomarina sp. TaxID=1872439 RepID=UPI0025BC8085|nr:protease SohB [Aliidiomarina sp.]MCH8501395.1 protease SohB [Aliidiomarina sp.]
MEYLSEYGVFLLKTITIVAAIMLILGMLLNAAERQKERKGELNIQNLSEGLKDVQQHMQFAMLEGKARKQAEKAAKKAKSDTPPSRRVFVIDFKGSMEAKEVESLRREVTAVLAVADNKQDEVVVRLESPGGVVHGYGLAAAQLKRLRDAEIPLTVSVDKVAASGGYMMACIANKIVAAPFAILGSIGVLAQMPNFHRWLKNHDIDFEQLTAGEYKRTLTVFGENTEKGRKKYQEDLEDIHVLFKTFVKEHRTDLNIDAVATGEIWFGQRALDQGLIDEIATSDDLLLGLNKDATLFKVEYKEKLKLANKIAHGAHTTIDRLLMSWFERVQFWRY